MKRESRTQNRISFCTPYSRKGTKQDLIGWKSSCSVMSEKWTVTPHNIKHNWHEHHIKRTFTSEKASWVTLCCGKVQFQPDKTFNMYNWKSLLLVTLRKSLIWQLLSTLIFFTQPSYWKYIIILLPCMYTEILCAWDKFLVCPRLAKLRLQFNSWDIHYDWRSSHTRAYLSFFSHMKFLMSM